MSIEYIHPLLQKHIKQITMVNDVYNGADTASTYLSQMPQELDTTFAERKDKVTLKNYVRRSIEAMVGMIYRKPIAPLGYSEQVLELMKNIDLKGTINQFSREITDNLIRDGVAYILVDSSQELDRPYFIALSRMDVVNWKKDINNNFTQVVIKESVDEALDDFAIESISQYRVYDEKGNIHIYRKNEVSGNIEETEFIDTGLGYIPLVELSLEEIPPMYDIARLNIKHMNRTSVKDRYLDMAACPVPVIWGANLEEDGSVDTAKPALVIGVDEAFVFTGTKDEADFQWRLSKMRLLQVLLELLLLIQQLRRLQLRVCMKLEKHLIELL